MIDIRSGHIEHTNNDSGWFIVHASPLDLFRVYIRASPPQVLINSLASTHNFCAWAIYRHFIATYSIRGIHVSHLFRDINVWHSLQLT
jgi:hypothetical protein